MRKYGQGAYGQDDSKQKPNSKSFTKVFRYYFDNALAKPTNFLLFILVISFILGFIMTVAQYSFQATPEDSTFNDNWWKSISLILKVGKGDDFTARLMQFLYWSFSIAISGIVIGFLTSKISRLTKQLNKGKSNIIKKNHILIVGWTNNIFAILKELNIANENVKNQIIVIFSERPNDEMQDDLKAVSKKLKHLKIVTRSGDPTVPDDLGITNPNEARSIIVLNNEEKSDPKVITTILSLCALLYNKDISIIASVVNESYAQAIKKIRDFDIIPVLSEQVISNVTAQACRERGLGLVVIDFLDFDGDELYYKEVTELSGKTYQEALISFEKSSVIGIVSDENGVQLAPAADTIINAKDELILVAEDDSTIVYHNAEGTSSNGVAISYDGTQEPIKMLFVGWSKTGLSIFNSMRGFLPKGSVIDIVYIISNVDESCLEDTFEGMDYTVNFKGVDDEMFDIETIIENNNYNDIVILGYTDTLSSEEADALTLLKTLQLDSVARRTGKVFRTITQLINSSKAELARIGGENELIVSDNLSALLMAQLVENPHLMNVFNELFESDGASINIFPIEKYAQLNEEISYETIVKNAGFISESAIGLMLETTDEANQAEGLHINPAKKMKFTPKVGDEVIVISKR